jgi:hypothetical protein
VKRVDILTFAAGNPSHLGFFFPDENLNFFFHTIQKMVCQQNIQYIGEKKIKIQHIV